MKMIRMIQTRDKLVYDGYDVDVEDVEDDEDDGDVGQVGWGAIRCISCPGQRLCTPFTFSPLPLVHSPLALAPKTMPP